MNARRAILVVVLTVAALFGSGPAFVLSQVRAEEARSESAKRPLMRKLALRVFLRGQLRRKDLSVEQRDGIKAALKDGKLLDALGEECDALSVQGEIGIDWQAFLDWLVENADEIIALILKLLPLFFESG